MQKNKIYIIQYIDHAERSEHKIPYIYSFMMISNVIVVSGTQFFSIVNPAPFKL